MDVYLLHVLAIALLIFLIVVMIYAATFTGKDETKIKEPPRKKRYESKAVRNAREKKQAQEFSDWQESEIERLKKQEQDFLKRYQLDTEKLEVREQVFMKEMSEKYGKQRGI